MGNPLTGGGVYVGSPYSYGYNSFYERADDGRVQLGLRGRGARRGPRPAVTTFATPAYGYGYAGYPYYGSYRYRSGWLGRRGRAVYRGW